MHRVWHRLDAVASGQHLLPTGIREAAVEAGLPVCTSHHARRTSHVAGRTPRRVSRTSHPRRATDCMMPCARSQADFRGGLLEALRGPGADQLLSLVQAAKEAKRTLRVFHLRNRSGPPRQQREVRPTSVFDDFAVLPIGVSSGFASGAEGGHAERTPGGAAEREGGTAGIGRDRTQCTPTHRAPSPSVHR